jgi:hypothetical protein
MARRVLYVLRNYPVPSQTYIHNEAELVARDHEVAVIAIGVPERKTRRHFPYRQVERFADAIPLACDWRPDVIHTHWIRHAAELAEVARAVGVPFTVRSHSFDVLLLNDDREVPWREWRLRRVRRERRRAKVRALNDSACLGVLGFPMAEPLLRRAGLRREKFVACPPVVRTSRFLDRGPNGAGVMVIGPEDRNDNLTWLRELAACVPELPIRLYGMAGSQHLAGRSVGPPNLEVMPLVDPEDMAPHYKWSRWLVVGANKVEGTVGWKVSAGEAWASGTGVCMPALRPDLADYVGDAGRIYRGLDELPALLRAPVPDALREAGFARAREIDVEAHLHLLTDLWERGATS